MTDFSLIEKDFLEKGQKVGDATFLFLDLSTNCVGFAIVGINWLTKTATFKNLGAFWLNSDWDNQEKLHYIYKAIVEFFNICYKIDACICENYRINVNKLMGAQVSIEIHGGVSVACSEISIKKYNIEVSTWRKQLGIKPDITLDKKGKKVRDYKLPTKKVMEKYIKFPQKINSNITGIMRECPSDLVDAAAQAVAFLQLMNFTKFDFNNTKVQEHNGQIEI